jgi:hypothetical protein
VDFLEPVDEIKGVGPCRTIFVAGTASDALFQDFRRLALHERLDLLNRFFPVIIHILTPNQAVSAKVALFLMPHLSSSHE